MEQISIAGIKSYPATTQNIAIQAFWITVFAALTAIGAQIEIPHQPVPYTLQTFFVLLSAGLLGTRNGTLSQLLYLLAGAVGVPVFAGWGSGLTRLFGPTGGYLLSFPVAAFATAYLIHQHRSFIWSLISMGVGLFMVFSLGTVQLNVVFFHDWSKAITNGFLIFSWWDGLKLCLASAIYQKIVTRWGSLAE